MSVSRRAFDRSVVASALASYICDVVFKVSGGANGNWLTNSAADWRAGRSPPPRFSRKQSAERSCMSDVGSTTCPSCAKSLRFNLSQMGTAARCPACQHKFTISSDRLAGTTGASFAVEASHAAPAATRDSVEERSGAALEPTIEKIGRFEVKARLGSGGFGVVYRAWDPELAREVALKVPRFSAEQKSRMKRFASEARAAARLRHPNIVAVFDAGKVGQQPFIAYEYIKGMTLLAYLRTHGALPVRTAANWTRQLAEALDYAHQQRIVHRDIKPENILLDARENPQILDFGLAKQLGEDSSQTTEGSLLGTPSYMSPEQARGSLQEVGPASDQYSLGATLYELLSGSKPFDGAPHVVISKVTQEEPPSLLALRESLPRDLVAICEKAMRKQAAERYARCQDMAADLDRWLRGEVTQARPLRWHERAALWVRRNRALAYAAIAVAAALVLGTTISIAFALNANSQARRALQAEEATGKQLELTREAERNTARQLELTRKAEANAIEAGKAASREAAQATLDKATSFCRGGDVSRGLLWMAHALKLATDAQDDALIETCRLNLAAWERQTATLRSVFPTPVNPQAVAASADGRLGAVALQSGSVWLWDLQTGVEAGLPLPHPRKVTCLAFSPDGAHLWSGCADGHVRKWSLSDRSLAHPAVLHAKPIGFDNDRMPLESPGPTALRLVRAGTVLVSGGERVIRGWDCGTMAEAFPAIELEAKLRAMAVEDGDDPRIWAAVEDGRLLSCTLSKPQMTAFAHPVGRVHGLAVVPGKQRLAVAGYDSGPTMVNLQTSGLYRLSQRGSLNAVAASADGAWLASGNAEMATALWDGRGSTNPQVVLRHRGYVTGVAFTGDSQGMITIAQAGGAYTWDLPRKDGVSDVHYRKDVTGSEEPFRQFAVSRDHVFAVNPDRPGSLSAWELETGREINGIDVPEPLRSQMIRSLQASPESELTVIAQPTTPGADPSLVRWSPLGMSKPVVHPLTGIRHAEELSIALEGSHVAVRGARTSGAPGAQVFDMATGRPVGPWLGTPFWFTGVQMSRRGDSVITSSIDGSTRALAATSDKDSLPVFRTVQVNGLAAGDTGDSVLIGSHDGFLRHVSLRNWSLITPSMEYEGAIGKVALSPDGRLLAGTSSAGRTRIWRAGAGREIGTGIAQGDYVHCLAFSPDGDRVVSVNMRDGLRSRRIDPVRNEGVAETIQRTERITGYRLDEFQSILSLMPDEWRARSPHSDKGAVTFPSSQTRLLTRVIDRAGNATVRTGGVTRTIGFTGEIPEGDYEIVDVRLPNQDRLDGDQFFRLLDQVRVESIDLSSSSLKSGLPGLSRVRGLRSLILNNTGLPGSALSELTQLPELKSLELNELVLPAGSLPQLKGCGVLESISLARSTIDETDLPAVLALPSLKRLNVAGTPVTSRAFHIESAGIEELDVSRSKVDDQILNHLSGWHQLRRLKLTGTLVTPEAIERFRASHPECEVIE